MRHAIFHSMCVVAAMAAGAWGQIVDSPHGATAQMVPGGGVGKNVAAEKEAAENAATSADEQLARALLGLKGERAALAAKLAEGDPRLGDLDLQIAGLREKVASRATLYADAPRDVPPPGAAPQYPRIVPEIALPMTVAAPLRQTAERWTPGASTPAVYDPPEYAAVRQTLERTPTSFLLEAVGLEKAIGQFQEQTRLNIVVNWKALQTAGVERTSPVSILLNQVPADRSLKTILSLVSGTAPLSYTVDGGVLTISTREDLESRMYQELRLHNVRDLLPPLSSQPTQYAAETRALQADRLVDVIRGVIAPDSWRENGGTVGSITELNGMLVINQTVENHRAIQGFLDSLRGRR